MRKHLLGLEGLNKTEITEILDEARIMRDKLDNGSLTLKMLSDISLINVFYENSTRTRTSFENAGKFLGANVVNIAVSSSSVAKGESLLDTAQTLEAIKNNIMVIRHEASGAPHYVANKLKNTHVINAGDGMHEHPTQALLDMSTMLEYFNDLKGLKVAIIGDIKHSRVARSNIYGLTTMGAQVHLAAPNTMMPEGIERLGNVRVDTVEKAIEGADVVMGLRIQLERQHQGLFPSVSEYYNEYGITPKRMLTTESHAIIMHPGPVNRGLELDYGLVDSDKSVILRQVTNGLAVRMSVIKLMADQINAENKR